MKVAADAFDTAGIHRPEILERRIAEEEAKAAAAAQPRARPIGAHPRDDLVEPSAKKARLMAQGSDEEKRVHAMVLCA